MAASCFKFVLGLSNVLQVINLGKLPVKYNGEAFFFGTKVTLMWTALINKIYENILKLFLRELKKIAYKYVTLFRIHSFKY